MGRRLLPPGDANFLASLQPRPQLREAAAEIRDGGGFRLLILQGIPGARQIRPSGGADKILSIQPFTSPAEPAKHPEI